MSVLSRSVNLLGKLSKFRTLTLFLQRIAFLQTGVIKSLPPYTSWTVLPTPPKWSTLAGCNGIRVRGQTILVAVDAYWFPRDRFYPFVDSASKDRADSLGGIWKSDNGGNTWTRLAKPAGLPSAPYHTTCLSCLPDLSSCYTVVNAGHKRPILANIVFHSSDKGKTWKPLDSLLPGLTSRKKSNDTVRYARCTNIKRKDGTESVALMLTETDNVKFQTIANAIPKIFYSAKGAKGPFRLLPAVGYDEVFIPNKNGSTWFVSIFPGGQYELHGAISFDPKNPNMLYVSGDRVPYAGEGSGEAGEEGEIEQDLDLEWNARRLRRRRLPRRGLSSGVSPSSNINNNNPVPNQAFGKLTHPPTKANGRIYRASCALPNMDIPIHGDYLNSLGTSEYSASVWRITLSGTYTSEPLLGYYYSDGNTGPFPDTRHIHVDPTSGELILTCDGGLFKRSAPTSRKGRWSSFVGTGIGNVECHSVVYDPVTKRFGCGNQDAGSAITNPGNVDDSVGKKRWFGTTGGDGGPLTVGPPVHPKYGPEWIFSFPAFDRQYSYIDPKTNQIPKEIKTCVQGSGSTDLTHPSFYQTFARNPFAPSNYLLGTPKDGKLFLSTDNLTTFSDVGPNIVTNWVQPYRIGYNYWGYIYGGKFQGEQVKDIWWAWMYNVIVLYDPAVASQAVRIDHPFIQGFSVTGVSVDPQNYKRVCIAGNPSNKLLVNKVYCSLGGTLTKAVPADTYGSSYAKVNTWTDVTGNFQTLAKERMGEVTFAQITNMIWIRPSVNQRTYREFLVASTAHGLVYMDVANPGHWMRFPAAAGSPPPVLVVDLNYEPSEDMIYLGTMGRGVWSLRNVGKFLT